MRRALLVILLTCSRAQAPAPAPAATSAPPAEPAPAQVPAPGASEPAPPQAPPPLAGFFESLPVAGHPDAFVSLPTGATGKRPVVVVIHGAGDRPDWQCGGWRRATGEQAFVVCPTGRVDPGSSSKGDTRYAHIGGPALLGYIDASLAALAARYPDYADTATPLLAGFSLGSWEVLALAVQQPARFPRVALVEGVTDKLDDARARAFVQGGGVRILFGCGHKGCEQTAKATAQRLEAHDHLPAHVAFAPVNHTFDPPLEDAVHAELAWLVEGDGRWKTE